MPIHPDKYQLGGAESDCDSREHDYDSNDDCDGDSPPEEDPRVKGDAANFRSRAWMFSGEWKFFGDISTEFV